MSDLEVSQSHGGPRGANDCAAEQASAQITQAANQVILARLSCALSYFNAKENLAIQMTVLYLGAVAWFVTQEPPFWQDFVQHKYVALFAAVILVTSAIYSLVNWQLRMRKIINYEFAACHNLVTKWLTKPPTVAELRSTQRSDSMIEEWPNAFTEEYDRVKNVRDSGLFRFAFLVRFAVFTGAASALVRLAFWPPLY